MTATRTPKYDHGVPWFWPMAAAIEMQDVGLDIFKRNLDAAREIAVIKAPPPPQWATPCTVLLETDTMLLRDFSGDKAADAVPVLVDPPFAGHSSTIADYRRGQSLVETLLSAGLPRVLAMDWKGATPEMRDFDIDKYLAEINVVVDDLGGRVNLVGLCQGGWMSAMYAARFPGKVASLVLAGAPIDTDAGNGPIKRMAHALPLAFYEKMVVAGGDRMLGKFIDLYAHVEDPNYVERTEAFERWYENPLDLPGRYYLQAIELLFKKNLFAKGEFIGLGRRLSLENVSCPAYLLAGEADDITTFEQVFAAEQLLGTPAALIEKKIVPGGHIGLFMGSRTLAGVWPDIAGWIAKNGV